MHIVKRDLKQPVEAFQAHLALSLYLYLENKNKSKKKREEKKRKDQLKGKKEKWVKDTIGQLLITTGSIAWTTDCTKALNAISAGTKG